MKTCFILFVLFTILFVISASLRAQNIVVIKDSEITPYNQALNGFKKASNTNISEYVIGANLKDNKNITKEIKEKPPNIIVAIGAESLQMIEREVDDIPIVYCMVMDPENFQFINKRNIAGIGLRVPVKDQIDKLMTVMPGIKKLGVMYNPANTGYIIKEAKNVLKNLGINFVSVRVRNEKFIPKALRKLIGKIDALWLIPDQTVVTSQSFRFIVMRASSNNLPLIAHSEKLVQAGALAAVCSDYYEIGKQAAKMVNDILFGGKVFMAQIVEPESKNLIINLKTADNIGINIPGDIISSAKKVFQSGLVSR